MISDMIGLLYTKFGNLFLPAHSLEVEMTKAEMKEANCFPIVRGVELLMTMLSSPGPNW